MAGVAPAQALMEAARGDDAELRARALRAHGVGLTAPATCRGFNQAVAAYRADARRPPRRATSSRPRRSSIFNHLQLFYHAMLLCICAFLVRRRVLVPPGRVGMAAAHRRLAARARLAVLVTTVGLHLPHGAHRPSAGDQSLLLRHLHRLGCAGARADPRTVLAQLHRRRRRLDGRRAVPDRRALPFAGKGHARDAARGARHELLARHARRHRHARLRLHVRRRLPRYRLRRARLFHHRASPRNCAAASRGWSMASFASPTLFSFVGTVLGGIWADQSWGRFWGWDPKENGAIIIVLWNALILHARWGGLVRERGLMNLAIGGNIVTSWSWFGTNMLGIGLHSYGFMDAAFYSLIGFVGAKLADHRPRPAAEERLAKQSGQSTATVRLQQKAGQINRAAACLVFRASDFAARHGVPQHRCINSASAGSSRASSTARPAWRSSFARRAAFPLRRGAAALSAFRRLRAAGAVFFFTTGALAITRAETRRRSPPRHCQPVGAPLAFPFACLSPPAFVCGSF